MQGEQSTEPPKMDSIDTCPTKKAVDLQDEIASQYTQPAKPHSLRYFK
jgi:hypothetical protein